MKADWVVEQTSYRWLRGFGGVKMPASQPRRSRLWLNDGSCIRLRPCRKNHVWPCGFLADRPYDGRAIRILTVADKYSSEYLAIETQQGSS